MTTDPFERAAKREEKEELKREIKRASMLKRARRRSRSAVWAFGVPYIVWALIRAASFDFGEPTIPQSIVRFFFKSGAPLFTAFTVLMLILIWSYLIGDD